MMKLDQSNDNIKFIEHELFEKLSDIYKQYLLYEECIELKMI